MNGALVFGSIGLLLDVTLALIVLLQGRQRGENSVVWAMLTFLLPFVGYGLWRLWVNGAENAGAHEDFTQFMSGGRSQRGNSDH